MRYIYLIVISSLVLSSCKSSITEENASFLYKVDEMTRWDSMSFDYSDVAGFEDFKGIMYCQNGCSESQSKKEFQWIFYKNDSNRINTVEYLFPPNKQGYSLGLAEFEKIEGKIFDKSSYDEPSLSFDKVEKIYESVSSRESIVLVEKSGANFIASLYFERLDRNLSNTKPSYGSWILVEFPE